MSCKRLAKTRSPKDQRRAKNRWQGTAETPARDCGLHGARGSLTASISRLPLRKDQGILCPLVGLQKGSGCGAATSQDKVQKPIVAADEALIQWTGTGRLNYTPSMPCGPWLLLQCPPFPRLVPTRTSSSRCDIYRRGCLPLKTLIFTVPSLQLMTAPHFPSR